MSLFPFYTFPPPAPTKATESEESAMMSWDLGAWHNEVTRPPTIPERTGNETLECSVTTTSAFLLTFYSLVARKRRTVIIAIHRFI